jgi:hypothetical protein
VKIKGRIYVTVLQINDQIDYWHYHGRHIEESIIHRPGKRIIGYEKGQIKKKKKLKGRKKRREIFISNEKRSNILD